MKIKVMVDANVLIYNFLNIDCIEKSQIESLFKNTNFTFITTTRILDEVIFKLIVIKSGKKLKQLKKDKELLKNLTFIIDRVKDFLKRLDFKIYELKEKHYWQMSKIIKQYGLLGNDALTFILMKENNIEYIATFDNDFNNLTIKNILEELK